MNYNPGLKGKFKSFYEGADIWRQQLIWNKSDGAPFKIDINVNKDYLDQMSVDARKDLKSASDTIIDKVRESISDFLTNRYAYILAEDNTKIEFIMSTIEYKDFNFWLVSQYNEYMVNIEDPEIAMLKYIVFKEA